MDRVDTVRPQRVTESPEVGSVVEAPGSRAWPLRLLDRPISHPVSMCDLTFGFAQDRSVPDSGGTGLVARFGSARTSSIAIRSTGTGGCAVLECWIPAEDLGDCTADIVAVVGVGDERFV